MNNPTESRKPVASNPELVEAIRFLEQFKHNSKSPKSLSDIAAILRKSPETTLHTVDKSAIHRWLHYTESSEVDVKTAARVVNAARFLRTLSDAPIRSSMAVIAGASEQLPLLLIETRDFEPKLAGFELRRVETVNEAFHLLEKGDVDIAVAPRNSAELLSSHHIVRFFRLTVISCVGLFPFEASTPRHFAAAFKKFQESELIPTERRFRIGCLPNSDFQRVMEDFLEKVDIGHENIEFVKVSNSTEATALLASPEEPLDGLLGHAFFIENVMENIGDERKNLKVTSSGLFPPQKIDVYVNATLTSAPSACMCFNLIYESVKEINAGRERLTPQLTERIISATNIRESSGKPMSPQKAHEIAEKLLNMFDFEVRTFEAETLYQFWKPQRPLTGIS